jgi:uncharacterized protein YbjQ (UPF0145 family)
MKKLCTVCQKDFEDFGHEHLTVCMSCNKPSFTEQNKMYEEKAKKLKNFPLTTSIQFAKYEVEEELGIVTAECVFGMNLFRDMFAAVRDIVGGRSSASQKVLRDLRDTCLTELKQEAFDLGADGVLAIGLDYQEFSGQGKGMLFLVASGTAVKFKK